LTPREAQVLERLSEGDTASEIALADYVAVATVRSQIRSILRKLDVSSQLAAVAIYRDR
jgi:DNA-binding CsgD family transcriptional regulator